MAMTDKMLTREVLCFAKKEDTWGTLVVPTATDPLFTIGRPVMKQQVDLIDDAQLKDTRSFEKPIKGKYPPGEFSIPVYMKANSNGSLAHIPDAGVLLECTFGSVSSETGVHTYSLANTLSGFSLWKKEGDLIYTASGCIINRAEFRIPGDGIGEMTFSGQFKQLSWGGLDTCSGSVSATDTSLTLTSNSFYFSEGAKIQFGDDDNSGSGYTITAINHTTKVVTFTPQAAVGCSDGATVQHIWPSSSPTEEGDPIYAKLGMCKVDQPGGTAATTDFKILNGTIVVENNAKVLADEKDNSRWPSTTSFPGRRRVNVTLESYLYGNRLQFWGFSHEQPRRVYVRMNVGSTNGEIFQINVPQTVPNMPDISGDEEGIFAVEGQGVASSATANDEISFICT